MNDLDKRHDKFACQTGITAQDLRVLSEVPLFSGIAPNELRTLLADASVKVYGEATCLFSQGDDGDAFYIVIEGWVKLFRLAENGQELVLTVVSPGESFAEAAIFGSCDFPANAVCLTPARLIKVPGKSFKSAIHNNVDAAFGMLSSMSQHLRRNLNTMHQLASMNTVQRVAQFLLDLCDTQTGREYILLPMDKSLIASRLSMQPETFSRAIKKLKTHGVSTQGKHVQITDVTELRKLVSS